MSILMMNGCKNSYPILSETDDYLAAKLSIPLSKIFEEK